MPIDTSDWGTEELMREARLQTEAIQRLDVWLRLGYSAMAVGFLLGWWGLCGQGGVGLGILGVVLLVLGAVAALVLKVGTTRARKNVSHILAAAGVELDAQGNPVRREGSQGTKGRTGAHKAAGGKGEGR